MMDNDILKKHIAIIAKHYPKLNLMQLGMMVMMLGVLRATMGHEHAKGTVKEYIHKEIMSDDVKMCVDFMEREILGIKKSKIDIDFWKFGKAGRFRPDRDKKVMRRVR